MHIKPIWTRQALIILSLAFVASSLSGCGIKPRDIDPPPGVAASQFPHTYPAPDADAVDDRSGPAGSKVTYDKNLNGKKL